MVIYSNSHDLVLTYLFGHRAKKVISNHLFNTVVKKCLGNDVKFCEVNSSKLDSFK